MRSSRGAPLPVVVMFAVSAGLSVDVDGQVGTITALVAPVSDASECQAE